MAIVTFPSRSLYGRLDRRATEQAPNFHRVETEPDMSSFAMFPLRSPLERRLLQSSPAFDTLTQNLNVTEGLVQ